MYILPQLLSLCTKNFLIENTFNKIKNSLSNLIDTFVNNLSPTRYIDTMLSLQEFNNKIISDFIINYINSLDNQFKNSNKRKENYVINKSNVPRTIITIFGTITFKRILYLNKFTGEYYFYVDDILNLEPYMNYDPIVRGIIVNDATNYSPNYTSFNSSLNILNLNNYIKNNYMQTIPKSTIYNFKRNTKIRKVNYNLIPTNKTLYVMVDEKWLHKQDKNNPNKRKYIMSKCFVTFTGIKRKGKRSRLIGKHVFITSSNNPWKVFIDEISNIYDFEKIETINLLSDAGSWILSGKYELKLYTNNKIIVNTCEFHVKQKINRSTSDKELRLKIADIIYQKEDKKEFEKEMDKLIRSTDKENRKQKIKEYKNYILKHWKGIINMKHSMCKSSMEAHIEHCISSSFSEVPKAYSDKNIETYLKLQEMKLNNINILKYYLDTYNSKEEYVYNEKEVDLCLFNNSTSNMPILSSSSPYYSTLYGISHCASVKIR